MRLAGRAALIGFAGAPLSIAAYLVEGRGAKDFPRLRALLAEDPASFGVLMDALARLCAGYLREQHARGADVVQVFDSWAGILSLADWREHVRPHVVRLLDELGAAGAPRVYFANGAPHLAEACLDLPCEALAVCWRSDLAALRARLGAHEGPARPTKALQGNVDPAHLLAGPGPARRATEALLRAMPARGHVVNLGHVILPQTPMESVQAVLDAVHAEEAR